MDGIVACQKVETKFPFDQKKKKESRNHHVSQKENEKEIRKHNVITPLMNDEIGHSKLVETELSKKIRAPVIKSNFLNLKVI